MSFPRANIKRFNDSQVSGPAPGTYDPKTLEKVSGGIVEKTERFRANKDNVAGSSSHDVSSLVPGTPVKALFVAPQAKKQTAKTSAADNVRIKELEKEIRCLNKEISDKERQLSMKDKELKRLEGRLKHVEAELKDAQDNKKSAESQRKELLKSTSRLEERVKELGSELQQTTDKLGRVQLDMKILEDGKQALQTQLGEVEKVHLQTRKEDANRIIFLEQREATLQETTAGLHERLVEVQAQNEDLAAALQETGMLLSNTKENNSQLEESMAELQEKWKSEKKQCLLQVEELVFEKSKLETKISDLEEKLRLLHEDQSKYKSESTETVERLTEQLNNEKAELEQLQNKLGDLIYEKSQLNMKIGQLEAQVKLVESESSHSREEADKILNIVPQLNEKINILLVEKEETEETVSELSEQNYKLQGTLEVFQADFDTYSTKAEEERQSAQHKIVQLTEEVDGLKEQKDRMASDLDDWLMEKSELEIEEAKLQCRIKVLEMEADQTREESNLALRQKDEEVERVMAERRQTETDMEQYGIDLLSNAAQIQSLHTELTSKSAECAAMSERVHTLESDLSGSAEETSAIKQELQTVQRAYNSKSAECASLSEHVLRMEADLSENDKEGSAVRRELGTVQQAYHSKSTECSALSERVVSLETNLGEIAKEAQAVKEEMKSVGLAYKSKCDECSTLSETNAVKDKSLAVLSQQAVTLSKQLEATKGALEQKCADCEELSSHQEETGKALALTKQQKCNYKQQIEDYMEHLQTKCDEYDELQQKVDDLDIELSLAAREMVDQSERFTALQRYNAFLYEKLICVTYTGQRLKVARSSECDHAALRQEYESQIAALKLELENVADSGDVEGIQSELDRYRLLYDDLLAKVGPFMAQIDAYEMEKQTLLGRNLNTQTEMEKLSHQYAKLLGHQNQKQKIKHICKIKDENNDLKREVTSLREQLAKQKRAIQKLEEKDRPRRFDPSKSFQHVKENQDTVPKSPLREANRK